jgi:hypothetical protein
MSAVVSKPNSPTIAETDLRAEALAVEQLRRRIAAASAGGTAASPALLAEFARTQKAYLDHKIEFEKRKRLGEVPAPELPDAAPAPVEKTGPVETSPAAASAPLRKSAAHWVWWALLAATASAVAWIWSH